MSISTITSKGQTTIPKNIRDHLNIQPGDKIDFIIDKTGSVLVEPATLDVKELKGILKKQGMKPVSVQKMREAVKGRFSKV